MVWYLPPSYIYIKEKLNQQNVALNLWIWNCFLHFLTHVLRSFDFDFIHDLRSLEAMRVTVPYLNIELELEKQNFSQYGFFNPTFVNIFSVANTKNQKVPSWLSNIAHKYATISCVKCLFKLSIVYHFIPVMERLWRKWSSFYIPTKGTSIGPNR